MLNRFLPYEKRRAAAAMGFGLARSSENGADHLARTVAANGGEQQRLWDLGWPVLQRMVLIMWPGR